MSSFEADLAILFFFAILAMLACAIIAISHPQTEGPARGWMFFFSWMIGIAGGVMLYAMKPEINRFTSSSWAVTAMTLAVLIVLVFLTVIYVQANRSKSVRTDE